MKLLFDENLSPNLVLLLRELFPESTHFRECGSQRADEAVVWGFARGRGLTIVSKDADFHHRSVAHGHPPKVVWVRIGNCSTERIRALLARSAGAIEGFVADESASFLELR